MDIVTLARVKCVEWHGTQKRDYTGDPYYQHPIEVEGILRKIGASEEVRAAALLHDVREDCGITREEIESLFGTRVADLVDMVTDVSVEEDGNRATRKRKDLEHLSKADADGQTIKYADLISNSPSIIQFAPGFAKTYMAEKLDILNRLTLGHAGLRRRAMAIVDLYYADQRAAAILKREG